MENASKALLVAAGILIAVSIMAIAVRLFTAASNVSKSYFDRQEINDTNAFNSNFTRFEGSVKDSSGNDTQQLANIHDIVSCVYFAKDYNSSFEVTGPNDPRILRINIKADNTNTFSDIQNWEQIRLNEMMNQCYYGNNSDPNANYIITFGVNLKYNDAGRVNDVTFYPQSISPQLSSSLIFISNMH